MKALCDLHVHTSFSDGESTPEEVVLAAVDMGMERLGFSDHAHTPFDESYCMSIAGTRSYRAEIARLKEKYRGKLEILCGVEQDIYSDTPAEGFDYVIGSAHYLRAGDEYIPVDESADILLEAAREHYGGDIYALVGEYYRGVSRVAELTRADIIGHFDLVTKFNEGGRLFDESDPRCVAAWREAADRLLRAGVPFEINTGAVSRGFRAQPYPARPIRDYIRQNGGRFVLSSDSHSARTLCYGFEEVY